MEKDAKIYLAGHQGLVGSALLRVFRAAGYDNLVLRTHAELDLRDQGKVAAFFGRERPDYVVLAAARVGGIWANQAYPAQFIYDNVMIQTNVIHQAYLNQVKKLLFLGSSCIYPKFSPQPMKEEHLLDGKLEPTNEAYAVAKIAGVKMCEAYNRQYGTRFLAVMPTNLYGPGDNFDLMEAHVIPALIRKCHEAKLAQARSLTVWGTGSPRREFLYVDDLADACRFLMARDDSEALMNVGVGKDLTIRELAHIVAEVVGYAGEIVYDPSYPDGTPRKLLDTSRLAALGWRAQTPLREGLVTTYKWFCQEGLHSQEVKNWFGQVRRE